MGARAKDYKWRQRLAGLAFDLRQLAQIPIALSYLIIPFVLLSGSPLVFWATDAQLKMLIRLVSIWSATHWIHNGVMGALTAAGNEFTSYDIRITSYDSEMEQWLSPCKPCIISNAFRMITNSDRLFHRIHALVCPPCCPWRRDPGLQSLRQRFKRTQRALPTAPRFSPPQTPHHALLAIRHYSRPLYRRLPRRPRP